MNTCGNCKHWEQWRLKGDKEIGTCRAIHHKESDEYDPNNWLARPDDASGYFASLTTKSSFGCTLWEQKESV